MTWRRSRSSAVLGILALLAAPAEAVELVERRAYEVITETTMPNLEESLRYATTRQERCLSRAELYSAFPALGHDSLVGCRLDDERRHDETISFRLVCGAGHLTTGAARWQVGGGQLNGTLDVRLGGKNMTFTQRLTATALGDCGGEAK
jgi:Protein of unknown function (DUF3617)